MVHDTLIVARKEAIDIFQHRLALFLTLATTVYLGFFSPVGLLRTISSLLGGPQAAVDLYLIFFYTTTGLVMNWSFTTPFFTAEKRKMETLLTTPLSLHAIWLGKSMAISLLCYMTASACALSFVIYMNVTYPLAAPVLPSYIGGFALLFCPFAIFGVIAINNLIQLVLAQLRIDQFVYFGFIFVLYRMGRHFDGSLGLPIVFGFLAAIIILFVIVFFVARTLTKEKIVLSLD